jgi:hypothetical protein
VSIFRAISVAYIALIILTFWLIDQMADGKKVVDPTLAGFYEDMEKNQRREDCT